MFLAGRSDAILWLMIAGALSESAALDVFRNDNSSAVLTSFPAFPSAFSNKSFHFDRAPLYIVSEKDMENHCEHMDSQEQFPYVIFLSESTLTLCGHPDGWLARCERIGCLAILYAPFRNPSAAGWFAHVGGVSTSSRIPFVCMKCVSDEVQNWLLQEGSTHPGALLVSMRPDEYNNGANVLSSWGFRSVAAMLYFYSFGNVIASLYKLYMKSRAGSKTNLSAICILVLQLFVGIFVCLLWGNISLFRGQQLPWFLFRICLDLPGIFLFASTFLTSFIFFRLTSKADKNITKSWHQRIIGSRQLLVTLCLGALYNAMVSIYSAVTFDEQFNTQLVAIFHATVQLFISFSYKMNGKKVLAVLQKGAVSRSNNGIQSRDVLFAKRVRFCIIFMLTYTTSLVIVSLHEIVFNTGTSFWVSYFFAGAFVSMASSLQIRAILIRHKGNKSKDYQMPRNNFPTPIMPPMPHKPLQLNPASTTEASRGGETRN